MFGLVGCGPENLSRADVHVDPDLEHSVELPSLATP